MAFWNDVSKNVGNFFGSVFGQNNQQKRKKDDEQQYNRTVSSAAPRVNNSNQSSAAPKVNAPQNVFKGIQDSLRSPGTIPGTNDLVNRQTGGFVKPSPLTLAKPNNAPAQDKMQLVVQKSKQQQLDDLTKQNMDKALKQQHQGRDFIGATQDFFTGNDKKIATQNARTQAVGQYQDKHGYNKDPEVMKYLGTTRDLGKKTSAEIQTQGKNLDNFSKGAYKAAAVAQYVPVTGSVLNLGLAGAEKAGNKDMREVRNKIDFGMTNAEYDKLDAKTKGKLETVRNIGLALSPLDFTGLGGLAKGVGLAKKAVIQTVKREAIDQATKTGIKTAIKGSIKTAVPAGIIGTGVSAGAQGYLSGEVDPIEALKAGFMTSGTSMLIPNGNSVKVPGSKLNVDQQNLINNSLRDIVEKGTIDVNAPKDIGQSIPVVNKTPQRPLINDVVPGQAPAPAKVPVPIRELTGDTPGVNRVNIPTADETAATKFAAQPTARPDGRVEGMLPGKVEDTTLYTKAEVDGERQALDQALANGEINKTAYKAAHKELDTLPLSDAPTNKTQINVKHVRDIPVEEIGSMPDATPKLPIPSKMPKSFAPLDNATVSKMGDLSAKEAATPVPAGHTRLYQTNDSATQKSDQFFQDKDKLANYINGRTDNATLNFVDVPSGSVQSVPGKPSVFKVAGGDATAPTTQVATVTPEVQNILDNPRQFNKRQVAAARNQRKLANQMAKTKEQTAAAIERIDTASPDVQSPEGFVPTGEFAKSANGGTYQKTNRSAEMAQAVQETSQMSPGDVIKTARTNQAETGGFNRRDIRNIAAMFEQKRIPRGTPEWQEARQILKEDGTIWGQTGALRNYTMRRNASADELMGRFESKIYRLANDPSKIDSKLFDEVDAATTKYTETRDAAMQAYNRFTESPTSDNAKIYHAAQDAADKADKESKMVEYKVANTTLKGNKDVAQARELEKMAQSADMYQMDAVDASMLSGTGTFVRNIANAAVGGIEESMFGKVGAKVASKLTGQNVGGGIGRKSFSGFGDGMHNVVDASKARGEAAGKNVLEHAKNWATTGNQLGDAIIDSQVAHGVNDHYTQLLKDQGYKGRELSDRAGVMARQDPDNITGTYQQTARVAAGLGSGITRNNKVETLIKNVISDTISGGNPNKYTEGVAKLVTRMTLGFPTAIGRSVVEGTKRFTLGAPTFIKAMMTEDPQARALLIKEGVKQAGNGALVIPPVFYAMGNAGMITGAYPKDDKAEQERWAREGISENSIKIGNDYFQLPAYLGSTAIPALFYAALGRNGGDWGAAAADTAKTIPSLLPTDQLTNVTDLINGRSDFGKFMSQTGASAVRAATPAGALFGEISKMLDPTQNDTNSGTAWENFISKVVNGIPIAANGLPDKTDAEGNPLANPNPLALALGASSTTQQAGVEQTNVLNDQTNSTVQNMVDNGAFNDPNLKAVITDEKTKKIYSDIMNGKQASPDDIKKLQEAMVKGVSEKGTDTAYLEREQYDTNLTALNIKRGLMASDPTTKPSDLKQMDLAITRGTVYRDNKIPYDLIDGYQNTSLTDWRAMGNPESDSYDPDTYQQLWAIDELMAKAGGSYAKGKPDKQKFSAKGSGKGGRGGGGSKNFSTDFGTLKAGTGAPSVQQYESLDQKGGGVPVIQVQRPNIVHKIGFSG